MIIMFLNMTQRVMYSDYVVKKCYDGDAEGKSSDDDDRL